MLAIDLLVEMSHMSGLDQYPRWLPGNHTSSIRHPLFLLSTISHPGCSSSSCLIFRLCTWNLYLPFVKALAQESGANVGVGQGQDLVKEENLDVAGGKCSKAERRRLLEITGGRGNMCDLMRGMYQRNAMFFLSKKKVLPSPVLCSMMIYTGFAFVYHHLDGWFGPELGWDLFAFKRQTSQVSEYWRFTEFI